MGDQDARHVHFSDSPYPLTQGVVFHGVRSRWDIAPAEQQIGVGPEIGVWRTGIDPVHLRALGIEGPVLPQLREGLPFDGYSAPLGNAPEHRRFRSEEHTSE